MKIPTANTPSVAINGKIGEPWVDLDDGRALANWGRDDEIAYNQTSRQTEKSLFFRKTFDFLTDNRVRGDYLEFGCHRARTFRMALTEARKHNLQEMNFWAFDSFEGLPELEHESSVEIWKKGALATAVEDFTRMINEHGIYTERVTPVKGYYSDSLTADLSKKFHAAGTKAALITVDCDLYESAVPVFNFVDDFIQEGTIIYMDDLFAGFKGSPLKGIARAFLEYQQKTKWRFIRHLDIGWWGRSYLVYDAKSGIEGVL
jgi:hypothetical protein